MHRHHSKITKLLQITILLALPLLYENCSRSPLVFNGDATSASTGITPGGSTSFVTCNDAAMQAVYATTYYSFLRSHACALCHEASGPGPAMASDDINQGYGVFQVSPGQYLNSVLNSNAVNPDHHGAGSPSNQADINTISATWDSAVATNCVSGTGTTGTGYSYNYSLSPKVVNATAGAITNLTWNIATDVTPASPVNANGVTLSAIVTVSATGAIQAGYTISTVLISTQATGIKISGAKVSVNGQLYVYGSTFVNSVADMPANIDSFPLSIGSIFIPMTPNTGDTFTLNLGDIALPTIETNYIMPSGGPPVLSNPVTYAQLIAPGGPLAVNCVQCHNPVFMNGNLNILDYNSVMQFVTPGLYSSHGDPESPMISLIEGSGANVMPPKGAVNYNDLAAPFISWFNAGATND